MARQFGNNTSTTNSQDNSTPEPSKQQLVLGVGAMIVIVLFIVFIFARNSAIKHMQAEELAKAQEMAEQGAEDAQNAYDELMNIGNNTNATENTIVNDTVTEDMYASEVPETDNSADSQQSVSETALTYAFDIQPDNSVFGIIEQLNVLQQSISKTYYFLQSEGYEVPDISYILDDSFDYDNTGKVINYHTSNLFYIDYYDNYIYYDENDNPSVGWNNGDTVYGITDITPLSTGWYYDMTEPTNVVLNRLFGYTENESMFHFQSRLKEEGSYLCNIPYNMPAPACYFGISKDSANYVLGNSDYNSYSYDLQGIAYCNGYWTLYARGHSVDKYREFCHQVDSYNSLRLKYLSELVGNIRKYVDDKVQNEYDNYDF